MLACSLASAFLGCSSGALVQRPAPSPTEYPKKFVTIDLEEPGADEATATVGELLVLIVPERRPDETRWAVLSVPAFLSAESAVFLPEGDNRSPTPRSEFGFAVMQVGRGNLEFGKIPTVGVKDPGQRRSITIEGIAG